ncbi:hypothetical protein [Sphingopyxis sp.]|jgi:hypothetical protein|uniref:hypothetical protein n=1 Tax=Sphingopyxis sp. TaxID=1908224 RepID=UPI002E0A4134|nr:hypothetical protein [Sphingopyxis sp.]
MRRVILFLLTILLASGTVAGSLAHASEERAETSFLVAAIEAGCVAAPATESAETDKKKSSSGEQQPFPAAPHGCHGHHSGVPAETLTASTEVPCSQSHALVPAATLPPVAYIGTFRPPIA